MKSFIDLFSGNCRCYYSCYSYPYYYNCEGFPCFLWSFCRRDSRELRVATPLEGTFASNSNGKVPSRDLSFSLWEERRIHPGRDAQSGIPSPGCSPEHRMFLPLSSPAGWVITVVKRCSFSSSVCLRDISPLRNYEVPRLPACR